ncbi:hypothetical protein Zmor_010343 [Zophobas morio]|uniref:Uncharacterized protein n=1 Tax=Zophobas morio TaxID=2755281 RepID=A0AA38MJM6_9CUCU|nr:hypothetical protein Zmor_010343 [Zophobas morio]
MGGCLGLGIFLLLLASSRWGWLLRGRGLGWWLGLHGRGRRRNFRLFGRSGRRGGLLLAAKGGEHIASREDWLGGGGGWPLCASSGGGDLLEGGLQGGLFGRDVHGLVRVRGVIVGGGLGRGVDLLHFLLDPRDPSGMLFQCCLHPGHDGQDSRQHGISWGPCLRHGGTDRAWDVLWLRNYLCHIDH